MQKFSYQKAINLAQASQAYSDGVVYLAGGTDLLVKIKEKKISPRTLIDLKTIPGMSKLEQRENEIFIGALTTIRAVETSELISRKMPMLARAASKLGSVQVRNRATIGGNLCNAAPSAETAPVLMALDARVEIFGPNGTREVSLNSFFTGPGRTVLTPGEILTNIWVPISEKHQGSIYHKLTTRKAMDIAFVGVAVYLELKGLAVSKVRIALGAVAPTPVMVPGVEELLVGQKLNDGLANEAGKMAKEACKPISDLRASREYRQEMVLNLCRQGLLVAYDQALSQVRGE